MRWFFPNGGFTPKNIAGLLCWYDAQDLSTITKDGSNFISQVNNKAVASTRDMVQATASYQPLYSATGLSGKPCFDFDGTDDFLQYTTNLMDIGDGDWQVFVVFRADAFDTAVNSLFKEFNDNTNIAKALLCNTNASGALSLTAWLDLASAGTAQALTGTGIILTGTKYIATFSTTDGTSGTAVIKKDNVSQSVSTGGGASGWNSARGEKGCMGSAFPTGSQYCFDGCIGEILVYNNKLSSGDETSVYNYLAARW